MSSRPPDCIRAGFKDERFFHISAVGSERDRGGNSAGGRNQRFREFCRGFSGRERSLEGSARPPSALSQNGERDAQDGRREILAEIRGKRKTPGGHPLGVGW